MAHGTLIIGPEDVELTDEPLFPTDEDESWRDYVKPDGTVMTEKERKKMEADETARLMFDDYDEYVEAGILNGDNEDI